MFYVHKLFNVVWEKMELLYSYSRINYFLGETEKAKNSLNYYSYDWDSNKVPL
jgi:hypothetical protein